MSDVVDVNRQQNLPEDVVQRRQRLDKIRTALRCIGFILYIVPLCLSLYHDILIPLTKKGSTPTPEQVFGFCAPSVVNFLGFVIPQCVRKFSCLAGAQAWFQTWYVQDFILCVMMVISSLMAIFFHFDGVGRYLMFASSMLSICCFILAEPNDFNLGVIPFLLGLVVSMPSGIETEHSATMAMPPAGNNKEFDTKKKVAYIATAVVCILIWGKSIFKRFQEGVRADTRRFNQRVEGEELLDRAHGE